MTSLKSRASVCPHCDFVHEITCPRIKAIEYQPDGVTVKRIEFHEPAAKAVNNALSRAIHGGPG